MIKKYMLIFASTRMLTLLILGFSSGIPLALTASTLQAWLATYKVDLSIIGFFSLVALPHTLKFVWAPFLDRYSIPYFGRRRGWLLITQLILALSIAALGHCHPLDTPVLMAVLAVIVSFASASQDIVVDAVKAEVLHKEEFAAGAACYTLGYRVAMLTSGALALILADQIPWKTVYFIMASLFILSMITTLLMKEPQSSQSAPHTLREAFVDPFVDFFSRKCPYEILLFIIIYKLDVVFTMALMTPFMMELGFTKTDIGTVTKGLGLVASILGTFSAGFFMPILGLYRSLWLFGLLQGISGITFYLLAKMGHYYPMMVATITCENFFSGMGNAAYAALLMSLCNPKFTGTQYALLSSLMALTRTIAGAPTGYLAKSVGWENYYLIGMFLAIPGLLLLTRFSKWKIEG